MKRIFISLLIGTLFSTLTFGETQNYLEKSLIFEQGVYKGEGLEVESILERNRLKLKIENKTSQLMNIIWEKSGYIGLDGKTTRIYDYTQIKAGPYDKLINTGIRAGDYREIELVPFGNLDFEPPLMGYSNFNHRFKYEILDTISPEFKNKQKDSAEIILFVEKGVKNQKNNFEVVISLEIINGKREISKIVTRSLENSRVVINNVKNFSESVEKQQDRNSELEKMKKSLEEQLIQKDKEMKLLAEIEALQKQLEEKNRLLNQNK